MESQTLGRPLTAPDGKLRDRASAIRVYVSPAEKELITSIETDEPLSSIARRLLLEWAVENSL